jgi:hypothetical protein
MAAVSQKEIPRATSQRRDDMAAISTGALIGLGALSAGTQVYGQHKAIGAQQQASREAYAIEDRRAREAGQLAREQERWNREMQAHREERLNPYRVMAMHSLSNAIPGGFQEGQLPRFRTPRPEAFDPQYVMRDDPMLGGGNMASLAPGNPRFMTGQPGEQISSTGIRGPQNTKIYSPEVAAQAAHQNVRQPMTMEERIAEWNNPQLAGPQWRG